MAASALSELERYAAGLPPLAAVTAQSLKLQAYVPSCVLCVSVSPCRPRRAALRLERAGSGRGRPARPLGAGSLADCIRAAHRAN